jgi:hypothetical protein
LRLTVAGVIKVSKPMPSALAKARQITQERLSTYPGSPFFIFAERELATIAANLDAGGKVPRDVYDRQKIGLMCARELETTDMAYCDAIYAMLDEVRP